VGMGGACWAAQARLLGRAGGRGKQRSARWAASAMGCQVEQAGAQGWPGEGAGPRGWGAPSGPRGSDGAGRAGLGRGGWSGPGAGQSRAGPRRAGLGESARRPARGAGKAFPFPFILPFLILLSIYIQI
jgi:hypothetical protein